MTQRDPKWRKEAVAKILAAVRRGKMRFVRDHRGLPGQRFWISHKDNAPPISEVVQ